MAEALQFVVAALSDIGAAGGDPQAALDMTSGLAAITQDAIAALDPGAAEAAPQPASGRQAGMPAGAAASPSSDVAGQPLAPRQLLAALDEAGPSTAAGADPVTPKAQLTLSPWQTRAPAAPAATPSASLQLGGKRGTAASPISFSSDDGSPEGDDGSPETSAGAMPPAGQFSPGSGAAVMSSSPSQLTPGSSSAEPSPGTSISSGGIVGRVLQRHRGFATAMERFRSIRSMSRSERLEAMLEASPPRRKYQQRRTG